MSEDKKNTNELEQKEVEQEEAEQKDLESIAGGLLSDNKIKWLDPEPLVQR